MTDLKKESGADVALGGAFHGTLGFPLGVACSHLPPSSRCHPNRWIHSLPPMQVKVLAPV